MNTQRVIRLWMLASLLAFVDAVSAAAVPIEGTMSPPSLSTTDGPARGTWEPRGRGGPDSAGYRWVDSDEADGPAFEWTDIRSIGTMITTWEEGPDDGYFRLPLPWLFPYYDQSYGGIHICTNGWMSLDTVNYRVRFSNIQIPSPEFPNRALYGWWDDLNLTTSGSVHTYHDTVTNRFIVQYTEVPGLAPGTGPFTFQMILKPSGEVLYNYLSMHGASPTALTSASIGIENDPGTIGLQVLYNAPYMHDSLAVLFTPNPARIRLTPTGFAFGNVLTGTADTASISIGNVSAVAVVIDSIAVGEGPFSLLPTPPLPATILPGNVFDVKLVFHPTLGGTAAGTLAVGSDDPLFPVVTAPLSGKGIAAIVRARPGVLYATASGTAAGVLRTIDPATTNMTTLGPLGIPEIRSLTIRPGTDELFGISTSPGTSALYRISADSGAAVRAAGIPLGDIRAIAFNAGDTLYGATGSGRLYRLNPVTGDTLFVGATPGLQYSGLSFSLTTGLLWAVVRPPVDAVYIVDPSTGTAAIVGATGFLSLNSAITHDPSGVPYAIIDAGAGQNYLATLDPTTAAGSLVSPGPLPVTNIVGIAMRQDSVVTDVRNGDPEAVPASFALGQNYPNPFNPVTTITFAIPHQADRVGTRLGVSVIVYDLLGRAVATLVDDTRAPGVHSVAFDASKLSSGAYIYRLAAGGFTATRRMMLVK